MTAKQLHETQCKYDRLHHLMRIAWLTAESPCYCDGTPVAGWDVKNLREQSESAVRNPAGATRSVDLNDAKYLAELDAFAATRH